MLEELLPPPDHPLYQQHRKYNIEGVERGARIASLMSLSGSLEGRKVLDIGCGTGGISVAFAKMKAAVYAMEPNHTHPLLMDLTMARAAREGVDLSTVIGRGELLPFSDGSLDIVILNDVLEHVDDPERVVSEASRVLKIDGLIYLSTPNKYSFKQILREGHSGLFGVTLLPPRVAAFYVTRIRKVKERYTVNRIHSYGMVRRTLERNGLRHVLLNARRPARHFDRSDPECPVRYSNGLIGFVVKLCRIPGIRHIVTFMVTRPSLQPGMFEFIVSKRDIPEPYVVR